MYRRIDMLCPSCGTENRPTMRFCCECGEPLDAPAAPAGRDAAPRPPRLPWELLLGLALLLGVAGVAVVLGWQGAARSEQGRVYHEAQDDAAHGDIVAALAAFERAGDYQDAPAQIQRLTPKVKGLEAHYADGVKAASSHAWWDAASALRQAADIQVSYRDVITRLAEARAQNGPIFYRAPVPENGTALSWAQADGGDPHRLPSGPASEPAAVSPDDHWAVYSFGPMVTAGTDPEGPFLLDLQTGHVFSLFQRFHDLIGALRVRFREDSKGFWWGFDNQAFYYDLAAVPGAPVSLPLGEMPGAVDAHNARALLNRVLVSTSAVYSRLLLADPWGRNRTEIADEQGEVRVPRFSDDGRYLLYILESNLTDTGNGHSAITSSLVLRDLSSSTRLVLYAAETVADNKPVAALNAGFEPCADNSLLKVQAGEQVELRRWSAEGVPLPVAGAASHCQDAGGRLAPPAAVANTPPGPTLPAKTHDGGRVLLLDLFSGPFGLYAQRPDGTDPRLVAKGATAFWTDRTIARPVASTDGNATFLDR